MKKIPELSSALIEQLDKEYPRRFPRMGDTDRQIWWDAGARSVVDYLLLVLTPSEEEENTHTGKKKTVTIKRE